MKAENTEIDWHILRDAVSKIGKKADSRKVLKWLRIVDDELHRKLEKRLLKKGVPEKVVRRAKTIYRREKRRS